jgi:hypothetical protein
MLLEGPVRITVTDLTGRRLEDITLIVPAGESSWTFTGNYLRPGVYILMVSSGSATSSARMLKIGAEYLVAGFPYATNYIHLVK